VPKLWRPRTLRMAQDLEIARTALGDRPMDVISWYRTERYQQEMRDRGHHPARYSQHLKARAVDFRVRGVSSDQIAATLEQLIAAKAIHDGGIGIYDGWVHYDHGQHGRRWDDR
jgi:uncharacterized protein YcbK (DUF882 family)